ncbi:MAG TPA: HIT family protein [Longimicrobiales bacterium]|nr:HIT family protein [Longimicrobiales bacterium]
MPDESCVFCRIIAGEEMVSLVHEDEHALAFMDIQPLTRGHLLVVSRAHHPTLFDLPPELASHCLDVARRLAAALPAAVGAEAVNVFCANGRAGGQDVPHFHLHLIPVREGDDFPLQLPPPDARGPSRSALDVRAARVGRGVQEQTGARASAAAE